METLFRAESLANPKSPKKMGVIFCYLFPIVVFFGLTCFSSLKTFTSVKGFYAQTLLDNLSTHLSRTSLEFLTQLQATGAGMSCRDGRPLSLSTSTSKQLSLLPKEPLPEFLSQIETKLIPGQMFFYSKAGKFIQSVCRQSEKQAPILLRFLPSFFERIDGLSEEGVFLSNSSGQLVLQGASPKQALEKSKLKALFSEMFQLYADSGLKSGTFKMKSNEGAMLSFQEISGTNLILFRILGSKVTGETAFEHIRLALYMSLVFAGVASFAWVAIFARFRAS